LLFTGIATHLLVNVSDLEPPGQMTRLELVNLHGQSLADVAVTPDRSLHAATLY